MARSSKLNGVLAQALSHPSSAALVDSKGAPSLDAPFVLCGGPEKQHISNEVLRGPSQHNRYPNIFACPRPGARDPNPSILPTVAFHRRPSVTHDRQAPP